MKSRIALMLVLTATAVQAQQTSPNYTQLGNLPDIEAEHLTPSPNGRLIMVSNGPQLWVFDRTTAKYTKVADGQFWGIDWSPLGDRIAFSRDDEKQNEYIWTMAVDPNTGRPVAA